MKLRADRRIKDLITDTVTMLCKNSVHFNKQFSVEGILGITLDNKEIFLVNINESVQSTNSYTDNSDSDSDSMRPENTKTNSLSVIKNTKRKFRFCEEENEKHDSQDFTEPKEKYSRVELDSNPLSVASDVDQSKNSILSSQDFDWNDDDDDIILIKDEILQEDKKNIETTQVKTNNNCSASADTIKDAISSKQYKNNLFSNLKKKKKTKVKERKPLPSVVAADVADRQNLNSYQLRSTGPNCTFKKVLSKKSYVRTQNKTQQRCLVTKASLKQRHFEIDSLNPEHLNGYPQEETTPDNADDLQSTTSEMNFSSAQFICSICGKTYAQAPALYRHKAIVHHAKEYACKVCNKIFSRKDNLRTHMLMIHGPGIDGIE